MPYIKAPSGIRWHYLARGKGRASLLFIHGWAGDFSIWFRQIDHFSDRFNVVVLDLPGHGKSDWRDINFESLIDDIIFISRSLKLKDIIVFGLSFGGQIAIKLALKSRLFKRLVLIDTAPKFVKDEGFNAGLDSREIEKLSGQIDTDFPNILVVFAHSLFTIEEKQKEIFVSLWDLFRRKKCFPQKDALKRMLVMIGKIDLRDQLHKIKIPTLIISGEKDYICPLFVSEFMNKNIPNSQLRIIEKCGHLPFLTEEAQFNSIIDGFLLDDDK